MYECNGNRKTHYRAVVLAVVLVSAAVRGPAAAKEPLNDESGQAVNVAPVDQATVQNEPVELTWKAGGITAGTISGYRLWLGLDRAAVADPEGQAGSLLLNGVAVEAAAEAGDELSYTYNGPLFENTNYYWRVDTLVGGGEDVEGAVWSFTVAGPPAITTEPETVFAEAGTDVIFSVAASSNTTNLTYQWYRVSAGSEDTALANGADYEGTATASLTVKAAQAVDEGDYYCIVSNDMGDTTSAYAELVIKRMIGQWLFNGNLQDASGNGHHGTMNGSTYVQDEPGSDGNQSLLFSGAGNYVTIPNESAFDYYKALTVSYWIKGMGFGMNGGFISKRSEAADGWAWMNALMLDYILGETGSGISGTIGLTSVGDNEWHHVVGIFDGVNVVSAIYIDGQLNSSESGQPRSDGNFAAPTDAPLIIGSQTDGLMYYTMNGRMSDVRIYNYALSASQVEMLYASKLGQSYCGQRPAYDFNEDCRVTYPDVAVLLTEWLQAGTIEGETCQNQPSYDLNDDCAVDVLDIVELSGQWLTDGLVEPVIVF